MGLPVVFSVGAHKTDKTRRDGATERERKTFFSAKMQVSPALHSTPSPELSLFVQPARFYAAAFIGFIFKDLFNCHSD